MPTPTQFLAIANGSSDAATSPDGITWTADLSPATNIYYLAFGAGLWLALGPGKGTLYFTSPDGVTWSTHNLPVANYWGSVKFSDGYFVVYGETDTHVGPGMVFTSPDGVTWTTATLPGGIFSSGAATYNGSVFVAVLGSAQAAYSPDGVTWTLAVTTSPAQDVAWGAGTFVLVSNGVAATSPDGTTWTPQTCPGHDWTSVVFADGQFVAVSPSGAGYAMTSPDGVTWTLRSMPSGSWQTVTWGDGVYVAVNTDPSTAAAYSYDGITWHPTTLPASGLYYALAFGAVASMQFAMMA
jgi:hypothetical protein